MLVGSKLRLAASLLALSASVIYAAPLEHELLQERATPPLPSKDPFYALPNDLDKVNPGAILRIAHPPTPLPPSESPP
ncbi:Lipase 4 [Tolypocladium paradoxum]|uniref:Lipase 4 n=1 Tax=Tolypocladium paradoxum TaxID=94208 RepID=A0A2S4L7W6_9HYPO|nr:Lipase 4 [Tolypocladium paradoxum]